MTADGGGGEGGEAREERGFLWWSRLWTPGPTGQVKDPLLCSTLFASLKKFNTLFISFMVSGAQVVEPVCLVTLLRQYKGLFSCMVDLDVSVRLDRVMCEGIHCNAFRLATG